MATVERVSERLKSGRVSCELQYPHDTEDAKDLDDAANVLKLFSAVTRTVQTQGQIER